MTPSASATDAGPIDCEVLVIGSGAGGGPLAFTMARHGIEVVVVEKGPRHPRGAYLHDEVGVQRRGFFTPPLDQDPHTVVTRQTPQSQRTDLGWIACCVGGGTSHMGAYLYRFHPEDFRMRQRFGSGRFGDPILEELVDWPFDYDTLEPYYALAERQVGVSGLAGSNPFEGPRSTSYPMPPLDGHPIAALLEAAIRDRGGHPFPTPRAVASRPYLGRPACLGCQVCSGYGCPVGARGSTQEALLPRAEATGRCRVLAQAMARRITVDDAGRATGCELVDDSGRVRHVRARIVCVCCSAIESARLLLLSRSPRFPDGLANDQGQVGRHLQFHAVSQGSALIPRGRLPKALRDVCHPFLGRSMMDHYFLPEGVSPLAKGGLIRFYMVPPNPVETAEAMALGGSKMVWGQELAARLRSRYLDHVAVGFEIFHDFLPNEETFVDLDPTVRDRWGLPVARIHLGVPRHHQVAGRWLSERAFEILRDLGASQFQSDAVGGTSRYLVHGTCRAGTHPETSVVDAQGRCHGVPNLYVADGAFLPTSGGASPTLTILANSFRIAERLATEIRGSASSTRQSATLGFATGGSATDEP